MGDTLRSPTVTTKLQRLAEQAKHNPERVFTNLAHLIDVDFLREAYRRTRKSSAAGIDGVTATQYAERLDENVRDLHERLRSGRYQAAPVVRVWIEKEDGGQRPIGKPAFEDKIVQRAVAMLLEAIYEQDFSESSYGFRPGRSPHDALRDLRTHCMEEGIGWIVDADVSGYFDSIDRTRLREVLRQRVNDGRIMRLIGKWLRAGVMEEGVLQHPETGVVQGGVISPVLANIFLHHVLDEWFEREVQPRLKGRSFLTRFADDWIIGCELEADAQRLMAVLPKRFARFGLSLHPEKTVLIRFSKPTTRKGSGDGNGTFDFLGLTHYWTRSRRGYWVILRRTARKRLRRTKKALWRWCRANRHLPLKDQYRMLCQKLRGHFQYYGIQGNYRLLSEVRQHAEEAWRYWLSRRSHKSAISWEKFQKLKAVFGLPIPKIVHQI
jgi:RNA-directed DNA polymerase